MPAAESPKSVVELLHKVLLAPNWNDRIWQAVFCLAFLFCWRMTITFAELARAWALRFLSPTTPLTPPSTPPAPPVLPAPACSEIRVVVDIPPSCPLAAVGNKPRAPDCTSGLRPRHSRNTVQVQPLQPMTPGHHVLCDCQRCANRRFNHQTRAERG
ncbi:hypothetical protein N7491_003682 [Penicillium cf. griseofulvum]|uniref:Uncharacterized protein n=1 Tax=Penicillium cf. griseofulvum TaxID=2972120 RepID=A0A9W9MQR0_9EURO|nr:hypothetical protein N7472_002138 [Penicillium cf. griseofulvum]KAJ5441276.1 hypothetical protein N7491_003682 [Penicillium cf. griseofulvum]KAJ5449328.1 hypothetical protein N7445_004149 [Penicillium cf. griseofulvum]